MTNFGLNLDKVLFIKNGNQQLGGRTWLFSKKQAAPIDAPIQGLCRQSEGAAPLH